MRHLASASYFDNGEEAQKLSRTVLEMFNAKKAYRGTVPLKEGAAYILKNVLLEPARHLHDGIYDYNIGQVKIDLDGSNEEVSLFLGVHYRKTDYSDHYSYFELLWLHDGRVFFYFIPIKVMQDSLRIKEGNFVFWNADSFLNPIPNMATPEWISLTE